MDAISADDIVDRTLAHGNSHLSTSLKADVLALFAPMDFGLDNIIKNEIENLVDDVDDERPSKPNRLVVVLETTGGYIEVVERIVGVFRKHYRMVDFIIPNYAYSAGTVLALSGDNIYMNYYSVLGPIDPQFVMDDGRPVPGMGYVAKYKSLLKTINAVADDQVGTVRGELAFLLRKFDPALIFSIEQAIRHSQELIEQWLPDYKFKNWKTKKTSGEPVTKAFKIERAKKIAEILGDAEHWHSHGRGIPMAELQSGKIGLLVKDFGENKKLNTNITHYHGLFANYMELKGYKAAIHTRNRIRRVA